MSNFDTVCEVTSLVCPHCGRPIAGTEVRRFQVYEIKVATWLCGVVAPVGEAGYDVSQCEPFPQLTFQVKLSNLGQPRYGPRMNGQRVWSWHQKSIHPYRPDYYVLCGLDEEGGENWFVLDRKALCQHGSATGKGGLILQGSANRFSIRGENTIWRYRCVNPQHMIEHIQQLEHSRQLDLFASAEAGTREGST